MRPGWSPRRSTSSIWNSELWGPRSARLRSLRSALSLPRRGRRNFARAFGIDRREIRRADHFQVLHVRRIVEKTVDDAGKLMNAIAGFDQGFPVAIHEARPALQHIH